MPGRALHDGLVVGDGAAGERVVEDVVLAASPPVGGDRRRGFELERHLADVPACPMPARGCREHDAVLVAAP